MKKFFILPLIAAGLLTACDTDNDLQYGEPPGNLIPGKPGQDDGDTPDFDTTIRPYQGETATDADKDIIGSDADIFWEANSFKNKVTVVYSDNVATVETDNTDIQYQINDAHVVIDLLSNSVSGVEINLSGKSDNGSLKIYGEKKLLLNLNGLDLASKIGPAINNQCKKRMFVNLKDGSVNKLTDAPSYSDDPYYLNGALPADEDRKGCLFSEGNLIFSGYGSLIVAGRNKHGIASDGYMYLRPGTTIAVTEAAKNAIHIKGDKTDNIGIIVAGGLIYTLSEGEAGKGLKTDYHVDIRGGRLDLNTKGNAIFDEADNDTSSAAGIKTDGNVIISGGEISIKSTGTGGKGINADGTLNISGGKTNVVTTGGKFVYNAALDLDSSPKGIKAEGNISIDDGELNIYVSGVSDGSEGLESKSELTINGGVAYIHAYDDAINAATGITINNGRVYAYSVNNDAIDSNGYLNLNGGLVIAAGAGGAEESFDCEYSNRFLVNGGTLIGTSGNSMTKPSSSSKQRVVIYSELSLAKDDKIALLDYSSESILTYILPRSLNSTVLFISTPDIKADATYSISKGGTLNDPTESWNGWFAGGKWSGGSTIGSFTSSNVITTVGNSGGGGGGGFPGRPW